jgi:hypothetical protein
MQKRKEMSKEELWNGGNIASLMSAYNTSYHRSINATPFEVSFRFEPRTAQNPNPNPHFSLENVWQGYWN